MGSAFETHGAVSWHELTTSDPGDAVRFYGQLFGWQFKAMEMGQGTYHVIEVDGQGIGGIMAAADVQMPTAWTGYVTVSDVDEVAANVAKLGGELVYGPEDIPNIGRFCWLKDPQGAMIAAISYVQPE
ncbi:MULTISPECIES: VOC family protein [Ferrimonas]|uniref:VOC family protein n=1 Tax=Ferrimonas TaxID=44011 RepID=UPI00042483E6|nr:MULTISPECIES: VOC family protein [Ferrimonas]USD39051.1 VOC family protein [Ferrimonas sp. SCSIO 43195]